MTVGELRDRIKYIINEMGSGAYPVLGFIILFTFFLVDFTILLWPGSGYCLLAAAVFFYVVNRTRKWAEPKIIEGTIKIEETE